MMKLLSDAPLDIQTKQGNALLKMALTRPLYLMPFGAFKAITGRSFPQDYGGLVVFLGGREEKGDWGKDMAPQGEAG